MLQQTDPRNTLSARQEIWDQLYSYADVFGGKLHFKNFSEYFCGWPSDNRGWLPKLIEYGITLSFFRYFIPSLLRLFTEFPLRCVNYCIYYLYDQTAACSTTCALFFGILNLPLHLACLVLRAVLSPLEGMQKTNREWQHGLGLFLGGQGFFSTLGGYLGGLFSFTVSIGVWTAGAILGLPFILPATWLASLATQFQLPTLVLPWIMLDTPMVAAGAIGGSAVIINAMGRAIGETTWWTPIKGKMEQQQGANPEMMYPSYSSGDSQGHSNILRPNDQNNPQPSQIPIPGQQPK